MGQLTHPLLGLADMRTISDRLPLTTRVASVYSFGKGLSRQRDAAESFTRVLNE